MNNEQYSSDANSKVFSFERTGFVWEFRIMLVFYCRVILAAVSCVNRNTMFPESNACQER